MKKGCGATSHERKQFFTFGNISGELSETTRKGTPIRRKLKSIKRRIKKEKTGRPSLYVAPKAGKTLGGRGCVRRRHVRYQ